MFFRFVKDVNSHLINFFIPQTFKNICLINKNCKEYISKLPITNNFKILNSKNRAQFVDIFMLFLNDNNYMIHHSDLICFVTYNNIKMLKLLETNNLYYYTEDILQKFKVH